MRRKFGVSRVLVTGGLIMISGCARHVLVEEAAGPVEPRVAGGLAVPDPGSTVRVGGDAGVTVEGSNGDYRSGASRIDTPLPDGYPPPTPPGRIDLKTYPSVRLAEVTGSGNPDRGMNGAFWPLFNHIKKHNIEMTSPVEMNFEGMRRDGRPEAWSMAFLYRKPELNQTGVEGRVEVRDSSPLTVIAAGVRGDYSMSLVQRGMRLIEDWLAENHGWRPAGNWRTLYYNGPTLLFWNKWAEVQLPVEPVDPSNVTSANDPSGKEAS